MGMATLFRSQHDFPVKVFDPRRSARRVVRIPTTIEDQRRFTNGVVTNISEEGCELRLDTPFFPSRHLTLKLYPHDETAALHITLAEVRWVKRELAGVEFVSLSQEAKANLQRLCSEPGALALGNSMPTLLAPGVYVEEVDPGVPVMPEATRVTSRNAIEQWCRQELGRLVFEENVPKTWGQVVQYTRGFLHALWAKEFLKGARASEAFFVKCDLTTMTPDDLREGTLTCVVGMAPMNPSEFIHYRIRIRLKSR